MPRRYTSRTVITLGVLGATVLVAAFFWRHALLDIIDDTTVVAPTSTPTTLTATSSEATSASPAADRVATTTAAFPETVSIRVAGVPVAASVADSDAERIAGLSNTATLPPGVVKLFVFSDSQTWSFWMKDMQYAIDILWLDASGRIVHVEERVHPDTYPQSFAPDQPARYVIETNAGFVHKHNIAVGETVTLPTDFETTP